MKRRIERPRFGARSTPPASGLWRTRCAAVAMVLTAAVAIAGGVTAQPAQQRGATQPAKRTIPSPEAAARSATLKDGKGTNESSGQAPAGHGSLTANLPCSACHTPDGWKLSGAASGTGAFDHSKTGFPLSGRHRRAGCTDCHAPGRRVSRLCTSCHLDEHQARLGQDCDRCHSAVGWFDRRAIDIHRLTRLPLSGMHAVTACVDCHQRRGESEYSNIPAECFACHEDDYRRADVHPSHVGTATSPAFPRQCERCHRSSAWTPAFVDLSSIGAGFSAQRQPLISSQHDLAFPITFGKHRGAPCESCHAERRSSANVRCTGCHAHGPLRLRAVHRTAVPAGDGRACLSCHPGGVAR